MGKLSLIFGGYVITIERGAVTAGRYGRTRRD